MNKLSASIQTGIGYPFGCGGYAQVIQYARENGKKLVLFSGSIPIEIIYASDCVPLGLDMVTAELAQNDRSAIELIETAERRFSPSLCGLNKASMGALLWELSQIKPDAYVFATVMCNSSQAAYYPFREMLGIPSFSFDMPVHRDANTLSYLGSQIEDFITFMEALSGKALNYQSLKARMELTNRSTAILAEYTAMHRSVPCPASSRSVAISSLMAQLAPTEDMCALLSENLEQLRQLRAAGHSPCPDGEKHRVFLMHNLLRTGGEISRHLEEKYSAVTVADGFTAAAPLYYEHLDDKKACCMDFTKKLFNPALIHGSAEDSRSLAEAAVKTIGDFKVDTVLFLGNRGCRHTLAVTKMLSDIIYDSFGLPMLFLDVDSMDSRYKSDADITIAIDEYMDTVVNGK